VSLRSSPLLHLGFASLHVRAGHLGAALVHRARYGRNPLVLYRAAGTAHARATRAVAALSLLWAAALVTAAYSDALGRPLFAPPSWLAWSLASLGLVTMVASQHAMGAAFRVGQHEADGPEALRVRGVHALSRNPIYLGSFAFLAGMTLWYPSAPLVALLAALGVGMHRLVLAEEAFLAARFGAAWEAYRATTPRYMFGGRA
jgi:protein-S-isoprenylcysteine O-methyltransferase Ste14